MGVFHRPRNEVHIFEKGEKHGTVAAGTQVIQWGDPCLKKIIPGELFEQLQVNGFLRLKILRRLVLTAIAWCIVLCPQFPVGPGAKKHYSSKPSMDHLKELG